MGRVRGFQSIALAIGLVYGVFYLYAIGDVRVTGPPGWNAYIAEVSLERALRARSTMMFEAVAVIEAGYLIWLISPVNLLLAGLLSGLLAANVHGALYLRTQEQTCRTGNGLIAGALPALLAGGACCAPSLILMLSIPAVAVLGAFFGWLVIVSLLALGLNRLWQHHKGAPNLIGRRRGRELT